eukprot:m.171332 g.171332  ORF g.171332 m.171332 type:complete len:105 (-) comp16500_c0_seq10:885-1199(-)
MTNRPFHPLNFLPGAAKRKEQKHHKATGHASEVIRMRYTQLYWLTSKRGKKNKKQNQNQNKKQNKTKNKEPNFKTKKETDQDRRRKLTTTITSNLTKQPVCSFN